MDPLHRWQLGSSPFPGAKGAEWIRPNQNQDIFIGLQSTRMRCPHPVWLFFRVAQFVPIQSDRIKQGGGWAKADPSHYKDKAGNQSNCKDVQYTRLQEIQLISQN
jgi:hypothetical protein